MPKLTLEEFLLAPETKPATEFACGRTLQKPMPDYPHSKLVAFLTARLFQFLSEKLIGEVLPEFRCIFGPSGSVRTYVPDLVYVAVDRLPSGRHLYAPPDLAVEVLSPDQHMAEFLSKIQFYLLNGVRLVWVIDPENDAITVQRPDREPQVLGPGDVLDGSDVLPGFQLSVEEIFSHKQRLGA